MTANELRAEGVLEIGRVESVLFVRTRAGIRLFHVKCVEDRVLDAWGLERAMRMFELGYTELEVSSSLGISPDNLRTQLRATGYERQSLKVAGPRRGAQARYRSGNPNYHRAGYR